VRPLLAVLFISLTGLYITGFGGTVFALQTTMLV